MSAMVFISDGQVPVSQFCTPFAPDTAISSGDIKPEPEVESADEPDAEAEPALGKRPAKVIPFVPPRGAVWHG